MLTARMHRIALQAVGDSLIDGFLLWCRRPGEFHHRPFSFNLFSFNHTGAENVMARKKSHSNSSSGANNGTSGTGLQWVNIVLDAEEIQAVEHLANTPDDVGHLLSELLASEGNFTVKFNPDRGNYSAFITAALNGSNGTGRGISASALTGIAAAAAVLVKLRIFRADPGRGGATGGSMGIR